MNHRKNLRKLSRSSKKRKALLKNLAISLIQHGSLETTVARAKELRRYIEKLITKAKTPNFPNEVRVYKYLNNRKATEKLFFEIAPKFKDINGGYTRIIRTRRRLGDAAQMAVIQIIDDHKLFKPVAVENSASEEK